MDAAREHIHIRVGLERPRAVQRRRPRLALLAAGDTRAGWLSDRWPGFRIREVRQRDGRAGVEHVRLPRGADTSALPGLDASAPTLLRDSVRLAFDTGVDTIDLLMVRREGMLPWELAEPDLPELIDPFLQAIRGVPMVIPDAAGPVGLGLAPNDTAERLGNAVLTAFLWSPILTEHFAVGVVDLPPAPAGLLARAVADLTGTDFAIAAWEGPASHLRRHGWRSAATLVGAMLATSRFPSDTLVGQGLTLRGGRQGEEDERRAELGEPDPRWEVPEALTEQVVRVGLEGQGRAVVYTDPALRAPLGTWTLPMLRTAKLIHHRLVIAAEQFVFRPTTQEQAITLSHALRLAVSDFERHGLLVGPGDGPSRIVAVASPDRTEPALVASVTSFLRPWLRKIHVDLAVRAGQPPQMRTS